jgi:hypothetical protein
LFEIGVGGIMLPGILPGNTENRFTGIKVEVVIMNDYKLIFEQELYDKLTECLARQARLHNLEWEIRAELIRLEQDEERINTMLARLSESKKLNPCSVASESITNEAYFEID